MRVTILLLNLAALFYFSSCEKAEEYSTANSPFKAIKNGTEWVSTDSWAYFSTKEKKFSITGAKRDEKYYQDEELSFRFYLSDITISNAVTAFFAESSYIIGGDVLFDSYKIDPAANNHIQITSLDTTMKHISGTFSIQLIRDERFADSTEVVQFKDGRFNLTYQIID